MKKRSFFSFLKNKYFIIGAIIVVIFLVYRTTHKNSAPVFESAVATIGDVIQQVSVTGAVSPMDKANLAFEKSGVISKIYVKVGDSVKIGDPIASLDSASDAASLASAEASLAELSRGLRPEEYAADQSAVSAASTTLLNAQKNAVNAAHQGFVEAVGAIVNYADTFFDYPQTVHPAININTQSYNKELALNNDRLFVSTTLENWQNDANTATVANVAKLVSNTEGYLSTIKNFLTELSDVVNKMNPGNSSMTQSVIDKDVATINTALSSLAESSATIFAADTELKNASSAYTQATNTFALQQAGSSPDAIASQAAKVSGARAMLAEDTITSPIDGIVTQADPNVGEFIGAGQSGFAVQNSGFKIEAFVPEADIAKLAVGNLASSTLDAYGAYVDFPAEIIMIDPAETILQGVPTYKVSLQFVTPDSRIRSGMTSNLEILSNKAVNVLEIPYRAVTSTATSTVVRLVKRDGKTFSIVPVVVGLRGSDGTIEIVSGLNAGDRVVTYVK